MVSYYSQQLRISLSLLLLLSCLLLVSAKVEWLNPSLPFSLDCGVEQAYSPSPRQQVVYTWSLNDTVVHSSPSDSSYVIQSPNASHIGEWRCQISFNANGESVLSHRVVLKLAHWQAPDEKTLNNVSTSVNLNYGRTSLVLAPFHLLKSNPPPVIEWFDSAEGGSISLRHRPSQFYITQNGSLVIFEPKNSLTLRATATNKITGDEYSFYVHPLLMDESPTDSITQSVFLVKPSDINAILSETVTFECIPRSTDIVVEWYRVVSNKDTGFERQKIVNSMQFQISKNRGIFLTIKYVQLEDAGEYQCFVKGDSQNRNATAQLNVLFSPVFPSDAIDREQLIDLDSSVNWPLVAVGSPAPNSSWYFNGKRLSQSFGDPAISLSDSGSISLSHVRLDHSGFYQCIAENSVDEAIFTIHVQVRASPPQIVSPSADKTIQSGDSVSFSCRATGAPQPRISWSKNGQLIGHIVGHTEVLSDGQLLIRSANVSDEGLYSCVAVNSRGNASTTSSLRVMTRTRIVLPPQNNSAQIGTMVQFYCSIQSDPRSDKPPTVTWYRNRVVVDVSGDSRFAVASNNSLLISQIRSDDGGTYECRVESNYGSDSKAATLTVLELPFPPIVHSAVPLAPDQPRAVRLVWSPGFDGNSPILNYIVERREIGLRAAQDNLEWSEIATFMSTTTTPLEGTIFNLLPSRTYMFRVRARNALGAGNPSAPSANVTLPAQPPSGPPQNFVGNSPSNSSIVIQWQPPSIEHQNGEISGYRIRYRLSGYNPPLEYRNISEIGPYQRSYPIEGLIPHKQYDVSIAAVNERGLGAFSNEEVVWTRQGRPTVPPQNVAAKPSDSQSILVTWSQPDPQKINGILSHYQIVLTRVDVSGVPITVLESFDPLNPNSQSKLVGNLEKYTNYSVQIAAETEGGLGPLSEASVFVRTLEDRPDPPAMLKIVDNIDTSMTAIWSPPDHMNGILTQYIVEYAPKLSQNLRKILVQPDVTNVTLTHLMHDTLYTVSISASTRVGMGRAKTIDIKSGVKPELADPPSQLEILSDNLTSTSAVLTFRPGNDRGSPVFLYHVQSLGSNGVWTPLYNATPYMVETDRGAISIGNLHPFATYQVRLFPINAAGKNPLSSMASSLFRTNPSLPGNVRSPVLVRAVNSTSLVVKWSPLNAEEWHGTPSHYLVEYKPRSSTSGLQSQRSHDSSVNAIYVTGLKPWTHYDIRLTAWNVEVGGSPTPTAAQSWRTWEAAPSAFPPIISATARNSSCIFATWRELSNTAIYANGVILGYKLQASQLTSGKHQFKTFYGNKTLSGIICGLDKYSEYAISVCAFTRMGDGPYSNTPIYARTGVDLPDPPNRVHFSAIGDSFVEIWWDEPELKGSDEITGYRLRAVSEKGSLDVAPIYYELMPNVLNFTVAGLKKDTQYKFMVGARNSIGWSSGYASQLVYTFSKQVESTAMTPPTQPLSVIAKPSEPNNRGEYSPASITITWRAPFDAYLPIRNYTLQYQKNDSSNFDEMNWQQWRDEIPWNETSYTARYLEPGSFYRFRIYATNDAGVGVPSEATKWTQPSSSPPIKAPESFTVKPIKADSVEVHFKAVESGVEFYDVLYCRLEDYCLEAGDFRHKKVASSFASDEQFVVEIGNLESNVDYEFSVEALNKYGLGPRTTPPVLIYVGDIVPSVAPVDVQIVMDSPSSVNVTWRAPAELIGESLIGYRVVATPSVWVSRVAPQELLFSVPASQFSLKITNLARFTKYGISVAAMSLGGDGPAALPVFIETPEDHPTSPSELRFTDVLLDAVTFRWSPPHNPNGNITIYEIQVDQQQHGSVVGLKLRSVKVQVPGDQLSYTAPSLTPGAVYRFSIRASTSVGFGPSTEKEVKTEPPPHAPDMPKSLQAAFLPAQGYVRLTWQNPRPHTMPVDPQSRVVGYLVDVRRVPTFPTRDSSPPVLPWIRVFSTDSPYASTQVSLDVLPTGVRGADVQFRVAARSVAGQSWFSEASASVYVPRPGELATDGRPYYLQHWFLGLIALGMLLILTVLIASLIVSGYRRRHQKTTKQQRQMRHGVIQGEHRRSNGFANGRPSSHLFGRDGPDGLNPVTTGDMAAASNGGPFGAALRNQRHNMYNSSIHSRTSRSRRPRADNNSSQIVDDWEIGEEKEAEAQRTPLWRMNVNVAKASVHINMPHHRSSPSNRKVKDHRTANTPLLRSPPRPSLAGYEPSESVHSASTSVIGGPVVSTAPHFSVVPTANAIASELASITGAKQRLMVGNGVGVNHAPGLLVNGGAANSAMDEFSGSQTSSPLDGDEEENFPSEMPGGLHDKGSIPATDDLLNDTGEVSLTNGHSTFQATQPVYGAGLSNYASASNIRQQPPQPSLGAANGFASSTTSFGFATNNTSSTTATAASQQATTISTANSAIVPNGGGSNNANNPSHYVLNNVAGTRQPLTGFSSFV